MTVKTQMTGSWSQSQTGGQLRTAVYDPNNQELFIGSLQGHPNAVVAAGGDPNAPGLCGLVLAEKAGTIYFEDISGTYPAKLKDIDRDAIKAALKQVFGVDVEYGLPRS